MSVDGSAARQDVLRRVRQALDGAADPGPAPRDYRTRGDQEAGAPALVELFAQRLADYRAHVHQVAATAVPATIAALVTSHAGASARMLVAPDFPTRWRAGWAGLDDTGFAAAELDGFDGAVTTCSVAIAETGTLVLDCGPGQGRRAITLVPDLHICLVAHDQVVQTVPDALARLDPRRPLTLISGPSATSDIELQRVEGVHGPRALHVVLYADATAAT